MSISDENSLNTGNMEISQRARPKKFKIIEKRSESSIEKNRFTARPELNLKFGGASRHVACARMNAGAARRCLTGSGLSVCFRQADALQAPL